MRFHVIGMPHTISTTDFNACAYTMKLIRFCQMMHQGGHEVIHYGNVGAKVQCTEHIDLMPVETFHEEYGNFESRDNIYECDTGSQFVISYNLSAASEIRKRAQKYDFIICLYSFANSPVADHLYDLPVFIVEASIGYYETFAPYRVFESYARQEFQKGIWDMNYRIWLQNNMDEYGNEKEGVERPYNCIPYTDAQWTDDVIGAFLDPTEFEYNENKEDYFLYLGRIVWEKGVDMAAHVAETLGTKLIVAGQGNYMENIGMPPKCVELVGHADVEMRKELMSKAKASFLLTQYNEAFGHVVIENALSGTPIITTDWGSFTDIVRHGETGYRIRNFEEAVWAAKNIDKISPKDCRNWGMNFTIDYVYPQYVDYFERLLTWADANEFYWKNDGRKDIYRHRINPSEHNNVVPIEQIDKVSEDLE